MKHHRKLVSVVSVLLLLFMCAPLAMAAGPVASSAPTFSTGTLLGLGSVVMLGTTLAGGTEKTDDPTAEKVDVESALATVEDKTLPISQRLGVAVSALRGIDPTGQLANVRGEYDRAMAELRTAQSENEKLTAQVTDLTKQLQAREADVTAADTARAAAEKNLAELQAKDMDLDKRAKALSDERMRERGVPAAQLPSTTHEATEKTPEQRITALRGSDRTKAALHFRAHKELPDWMADAEKRQGIIDTASKS